MVTVPLYIKVRAEEGSPLPAEQEDLIHRGFRMYDTAL